MTIFCSHCHRPLQAEMSCLPRRGKQAPSTSKPFRSTKSASKARRDQINVELQALRSLLPISTREKERLSYLHTMALVCLRLRGAQLFPPGSAPPAGPTLGSELLSLLPGFLLVLSASGKLVYVSENVAQVLGLSMVELLAQGDSIFDILDGRVREEVRKKLLLAQEEPGREVTFVSEMRTSKAFRARHGGDRAVAVRGRFTASRCPASPSTAAFLALCTPVTWSDGDASSQDSLFQSTHTLDMTFIDITESVTYHLGYPRQELIGQSWYSLLHPEDTDLAAAQHRAL
ncbi:NPAS4 protein, partial [Zapornia atra]|nr:NPAS4 protein [Zapornia atra]